MKTQMTKDAVAIRGEFIIQMIRSGYTAKQVEDMLKDKATLKVLNCVCQALANVEQKNVQFDTRQ